MYYNTSSLNKKQDFPLGKMEGVKIYSLKRATRLFYKVW